ncbi:ABC transporter substrate-binding protein [Halostagnicola bangensis]
MNDTPVGHGQVSRRSLLATGAAGASLSTAGCVRQLRSIVNRDRLEQLSLTITTLPADGDREGIQLARHLRANLEAAGVDVSLEMRSQEEFLRAILINHDFDCYVGRHPGSMDPDFLYEALHSLYAEESGWQNPFGFTNLAFDELLEAQRRADDGRQDAVTSVLETLAVEVPFVPVCVPEEYRLVRTDRFDGWDEYHPATRLGPLGLEPTTETDQLRTVVIDARPSQNLNPLAAEYRSGDTFVDLLYDSLATENWIQNGTDQDDTNENEDDDDATTTTELLPWLAESWEWNDDTLEVTIREDCTFHDGEPLTAEDVEFTYNFLADTSMGESEVQSPAPIYRGLVSAIDEISVEPESDHQLSFTVETGEAVAERALTVPILPKHVWEERSSSADIPGYRVAEGTTDALVTDNIPAVGSGPFEFGDRAEREHLTLERFDDHFTRRDSVDLPEASVEELYAGIDPRSTSAISLVESNDADMTLSTLETYAIEDVTEGDGVELRADRSWSFYHLGFNTRTTPFSNPRFRQLCARLIDRERVVEEIFEGYARPVEAPVTDEWMSESLEWDGSALETPFLGSDGEVDVGAARQAFAENGFSHNGDGELLVRR